ncbi:MAG: hypothetical protein GVY08_02060 [Bacteroidetes bacterium]|jgi:hypothetical protein|nr:hypothetical protein [Bacteroidota bacterium]
MNKKTRQKIQIARAAADLYLKNNRFKMSALADEAEVELDLVLDYFPNRTSVLEYYYEASFIEYREVTKQIQGYDEFTLAEKLSNLSYTLLDLFSKQKPFVRKTYRSIIVCSSKKTSFSEMFKKELQLIYETDPRQSALSSAFNNRLLYKAGLANFHLLIGYWLEDESTGDQKTMELVDKWTAFIQEIHYTAILDRGFDLAKFLYYHSPFRPGKSPSN